MSFTIPESLTRLQITTFVEGAELANLSRSEIIREGSKKMAEQALKQQGSCDPSGPGAQQRPERQSGE